MSLANIVRLLVQFFAIPILARRLSPFDYGLVGMAMPIMAFSMMIADAGMGMSLIRTSASSSELWATGYWLSVFLGVLLAVFMCAVAPMASWWFHTPELSPVIMVLALAVLGQAILIIPSTMLQQKQRFHSIATIDIVATGTSIGTAVTIAMLGGGAWALVGQQLTYAFVKLIATHVVSPFRPVMALDLRNFMEHLTFSRDVLTINIVRFFTRSLDNLAIGNALGAAAVGIYAMTWQFVGLPLMLVTGPVQYVLYAQLADIMHDRSATRRLFLILVRGLATLAFPAIGMIAVAHQPIFSLLLSDKWAMSGELFLLLAPVSAIQAVTAICGTVMLAFGRTDIQLRTTTEFGLIWVVALFASVWFGLEKLVIVYSIAVILYTPRSLMLVLPVIGCPALAYLRVFVVPVSVTAVCVVAYLAIPEVADLGRMRLALSAGALATAGVILGGLLQWNALVTEITLWRKRAPRDLQVAA